MDVFRRYFWDHETYAEVEADIAFRKIVGEKFTGDVIRDSLECLLHVETGDVVYFVGARVSCHRQF